MSVDVEVALPAGWFPLGPVPGVLLAAAATARDGRAVATMVIRMHHCAGLTGGEDAEAVLAAVRAGLRAGLRAGGDDDDPRTLRDVRWCGPETVAVLAASAPRGVDVTPADLADALHQTAVYAVDSTGNAINPSSAGAASDG